MTKPVNPPKNMKILVIVGGSGPTDRDCTLGKITLYKDIAQSLANKGIACFRYDKRAFSHRDKMSMEYALDMTLNEEYLEDYNEIIKYLSSRNDIDNNNIYVAGHSQGGNIIPMLDKTNNKAKGYNPGKESAKINKPMLFLQGLNDYQVTESELNKFKGDLKDKNDVKFITYEGLTHMFTKGDNTPNAYMKEEKVSQKVVDDIVRFMN